MEDSEILDLYWKRDAAAITETERKYGRFCFSVASNILHDPQDAQECVNDTYLGAWNTIPPHRPETLSAFLGKITRRLSLKKRRERLAQKRGGGKTELSLEELEECIPSEQRIDESVAAAELTSIVNAFLEALPVQERRVFLRRYWYCDSIRDICSRYGYRESKVKMMLKRLRDKLRDRLRKEDIWV